MSLILASTSTTRQNMLKKAGVTFQAQAPSVDEDAIKEAFIAEEAPPRDICDALAEAKALSLSFQFPEQLIVGGDQILVHKGKLLSKSKTRDEAAEVLNRLSGDSHTLMSGAVLSQNGQTIWRHIDQVEMVMHSLSPDEIDRYLDRIGDAAFWTVGAYQLEGLGASLFKAVKGDFFTVLGFPLLPLLAQLRHLGLYP